MLIPAEVWTLAKTDQGHAVLVRPKGSEIAVPIFIGYPEAQSIFIGLGNLEMPRPLTHDLLISVLKQLTINIKRIEITDLTDHTFYARLILDKDGTEISIDSRPSDCIAIAVRVKCDIFIDEAVVDEAGISINIIDEESHMTHHKNEAEIAKLKQLLDIAVEEENYEEAARLRDSIKDLENQNS
jgi:uncharacterized protein